MEPSSAQRQRLPLMLLLLVLFQLCPQGGALELSPSVSEVVLSPNASFTVVCSGWGKVGWKLPQDVGLEGVLVENQGTRSVLELVNVTWRHSGSYVCEEPTSEQSRDIDVFVPGHGPEEWFVPSSLGVVMKEGEEGTIPCVVSDPRLSVALYERPGRVPVNGTRYRPGKGFQAALRDSSYVCVAAMDGREAESQVFYVFSIVVPQSLAVVLSVSQSVLKQGEVLTVNCTVKDVELVYFTWDFPRRQEFEPLTDFPMKRIRSCVNISMATLADSGVYVCTVQDTVAGQTAVQNVTITVLERGYIDVVPAISTNVSASLHETVELALKIDAYPAPTVVWSKHNSTITSETTPAEITHIQDTRYLSTLTLVRVRMDQRGVYTAVITNEDDVRELTFHLQVTAPPRITNLSDQHAAEGHAVLCVTEGLPAPTVTWYTCTGTQRCSNKTVAWQRLTPGGEGVSVQENFSYVEERGVNQVRSVLTLQSIGSISAVRCEARNERGRRAWDIRMVSSSLLSQVAVLAAILVLVVIAVIFLIILILLWRKKPRYEIRWKVIESVSPDGHEYSYVDPTQLPYNSAWEVPRDNLVLGHTLGSGAFGRVVEATLYGLLDSQSSTKVAVKMLKSTARRSEMKALVSELKIMSHLGPHLNLVNLLGACTQRGPIYLITEYCRYGDLVDYLHRNKHTFLPNDSNTAENHLDTHTHSKSDGDGGYMDMTQEDCLQYVPMQELGDTIKYADIEPAVYETPYQQHHGPGEPAVSLSDSPLLTLQDLLCFSYQVAQGMAFLASKNCLHRDLAARNVLVCEGKLAKICDFGLARDVMKDDNYIAKGNSFLPVKWMAPESIFQNVYTTLSDVWSYGVLLWEMFTLGGSPYSDIPMNDQFYTALKTGYRLPRPAHATDEIYEVITRCWEEKSEARPPFSSLIVSVGNILTDGYKKRYDQASEWFQRCSQPVLFRTSRPAGQTEAHAGDHGGGGPDESLQQAEEAGPSSSTYIIPITDITIETSGQVLDTATQEAESSQGAEPQEVMSEPAQEGEEPQTRCTPEKEPQEVMSEPAQEGEEPPTRCTPEKEPQEVMSEPAQEGEEPQTRCTPEEEESFL